MFLDNNLKKKKCVTDYISPIHVEFVEHPDLTCQWKLMENANENTCMFVTH